MDSSGKPSGSLPTILGNASVCVCHLRLPCMLSPTQGPSQLYVTHEGYSGVLEVIDDSSLWNEWLTKKVIHGIEQHAYSFCPLRKKCSKYAWGETDLGGPHGRCECLPQSTPGHQEKEEKRGSQVAISS